MTTRNHTTVITVKEPTAQEFRERRAAAAGLAIMPLVALLALAYTPGRIDGGALLLMALAAVPVALLFVGGRR